MIELKSEIFTILIRLKESKEYFNIFFISCLLDAIDDNLDLESDEVILLEELRKWVNETTLQTGVMHE